MPAETPEPVDPREARFIDEFLIDLNGTQAVIRAGYSENGADVQASRLLGKARVSDEIARRKAILSKRFKLSHEQVIREFVKIGMFDCRTCFNDDGSLKQVRDWTAAMGAAISSIESEDVWAGRGETRVKTGVVHKVRFHDKNAALVQAGKHIGMFVEQPHIEQLWALLPPDIAEILRGLLAERSAGGANAGADRQGASDA